jgi:hypothetical protein
MPQTHHVVLEAALRALGGVHGVLVPGLIEVGLGHQDQALDADEHLAGQGKGRAGQGRAEQNRAGRAASTLSAGHACDAHGRTHPMLTGAPAVILQSVGMAQSVAIARA